MLRESFDTGCRIQSEMVSLYAGRVARLSLTVGRGAYAMEAGMIVQMAIAWTILCA